MKNINKQRKASLLVLTFAMALAIYLNRQYARGTADNYISVDDTIQQTNARAEMDQSDMLMGSDDYETKNYGDAQLVATTRTDSEKYFEEARLARQKSRDEALDTVQKTLKNAKLTDDEKKQTEELVNKWIEEDLPVEKLEMSKEKAIQSGAECTFIDRYPDVVTVYKIDDISMELCGGPHVSHTGELGHFKIKKEEASSAGVRRIKAILE